MNRIMKNIFVAIIVLMFSLFPYVDEVSARGSSSVGGCYGGVCSIPFREDRENEKSRIETPYGIVRIVNSRESANHALRSLECGSGAIIEPSAGRKFILTAAHLFRDGIGEVSAVGREGERVACELVHRDDLWDIALLEPRTKIDVPAIPLCETAGLKNETAYIIGFGPVGELRVFPGKISGYSQIRGADGFETMKIATAVRNGDSGGPVVNSRGELIGVVWGTDRNSSYATYIGRIRRIIETAIESDRPSDENPDRRENETLNSPEKYRNGIGNDTGRFSRENDEGKRSKVKNDSDPKENGIEPADGEEKREPQSIINDKCVSADKSDGIHETSFTTTVLGYALGSLGLSCPPSIAGFLLLKSLLKSRFNNVEKNRNPEQRNYDNEDYEQSARANDGNRSGSAGNIATDKIKENGSSDPNHKSGALNDEYAEQLNANYELSGRTTAADATLGRLYEQRLSEAESSSNAEISKYAKLLRKQIAEQFFRIHSSSPLASEW